MSYPAKLSQIIELFETLPNSEKREALISYADSAMRQGPKDRLGRSIFKNLPLFSGMHVPGHAGTPRSDSHEGDDFNSLQGT